MPNVIIMPKLGLTMSKATILTWRKQEGEHVERGEVLLEIETDKIVNDVESTHSGTLLRILAEEGAEVAVLSPVAIVGEKGEEISGYDSSQSPSETLDDPAGKQPGAPAAGGRSAEERGNTPGVTGQRQSITPRARRLIREHNIALSLFEGRTGRITECDVREVLASGSIEDPQAAILDGHITGEKIPLSRAQAVLAEKMTESYRDLPQFSLRCCVEMDNALSMLDASSAAVSPRITLNTMFLRAIAISLSQESRILRHYRGDSLFQPARFNVGFAVEWDENVYVPVIHDAEKKNIEEISREVSQLMEKVRAGALKTEDVTGGNVTVSNLGMYGVRSFVPLLIPGQGAIIGIGEVRESCREKEGAIESFHVAEVTVVCDHRSVNGAVAAAFCQELKRTIESEEASSW